jgi:hypothetical protein
LDDEKSKEHHLLSEFILQQAQVAPVVLYFQRWIGRLHPWKRVVELPTNECETNAKDLETRSRPTPDTQLRKKSSKQVYRNTTELDIDRRTPKDWRQRLAKDVHLIRLISPVKSRTIAGKESRTLGDERHARGQSLYSNIRRAAMKQFVRSVEACSSEFTR